MLYGITLLITTLLGYTTENDELLASGLRHFATSGKFSVRQVQILREHFNRNPYPDIIERLALANMFNASVQRVGTWFEQKRYRARHKYKTNEGELSILRSYVPY